MARPWIVPGTAGQAHRIGGLEKDAKTGAISSDAANHACMVALRAEKIARLARYDDDALVVDRDGDDLLVIGWGSTWGPIKQAVRDIRAAGQRISHLHLRRLWPLPHALGDLAKQFRKVVCVEMNEGQLTRVLRATYLLPVEAITQVSGRPFRADTLQAAFISRLKEQLS
jgi:2-oxoglutarate ferredoxin oxidoreductase subunit alpha